MMRRDKGGTWSARLVPRFILAPLVVPVLFWVDSLLRALADPSRRHLALQAPFGGLGLVLAFGAAIAYGATLVAAVPAIWLLRYSGKPAMIAVLALGAGVGLATALTVGPQLRGELFGVNLRPSEGAVFGAISAAVFWRIAVGLHASRSPRS